MSRKLPPCDHDECPPTHCKQPGSLDASAGSALSAKSRAALALFTTKWQPCPIRVHIKTLMALIRGKHIEWRDRLPFISPELHQWKINCEFRLPQNNELTGASPVQRQFNE